jgi:hypothetical protein
MPPSPRAWPGRIGAVAGAALVAAALWLLWRSLLPQPATIVLALAGATQAVLGWRLGQGGRATWAFAVALTGVLALVALLAVPALRRLGLPPPLALAPVVVEVGLTVWYAILPPAAR